MQRIRQHSPQTVAVLQSLAADPSTWRHGYDLCLELGLKSGSLYPILVRLADRGLLESMWGTSEPGRPPRHLYRLTATGLADALASGRPAERAKARGIQQLRPA